MSAVETQLSCIERGIFAVQLPLPAMALPLRPKSVPMVLPQHSRRPHYAAPHGDHTMLSSDRDGTVIVLCMLNMRAILRRSMQLHSFMQRSRDDYCNYTGRSLRSHSVLVIFQSL